MPIATIDAPPLSRKPGPVHRRPRGVAGPGTGATATAHPPTAPGAGVGRARAVGLGWGQPRLWGRNREPRARVVGGLRRHRGGARGNPQATSREPSSGHHQGDGAAVGRRGGGHHRPAGSLPVACGVPGAGAARPASSRCQPQPLRPPRAPPLSADNQLRRSRPRIPGGTPPAPRPEGGPDQGRQGLRAGQLPRPHVPDQSGLAVPGAAGPEPALLGQAALPRLRPPSGPAQAPPLPVAPGRRPPGPLRPAHRPEPRRQLPLGQGSGTRFPELAWFAQQSLSRPTACSDQARCPDTSPSPTGPRTPSGTPLRPPVTLATPCALRRWAPCDREP